MDGQDRDVATEPGADPADPQRLDPDRVAADADQALAADDPARAAWLFVRLSELEPWVDEWRTRAHAAWLAAGDVRSALQSARAETAERPHSATAWMRLGRALAVAGDAVEAVRALSEAWHLRPDAQTGLDRAGAQVSCGDLFGALETLSAAARAFPDDGAIALKQAELWIGLGEHEKAQAALARAQGLVSDDPAALAALRDRMAHGMRSTAGTSISDSADTAKPVAPPDPAYVRALFDGYAPRFDADLTVRLNYRGPVILAQALARLVPDRRDLDVIDLGCGTGLSGVPLRPYARRLVGVDLSPRMLAVARARALYDAHIEEDVVAALERWPDAWDLVVAADVLVYLGPADPMFARAARALRPGGLLLVTVEEARSGTELAANRRYRHGADHLRQAAAAVDLSPVLLERCQLRTEGRAPVPGIVCACRRD